MSTTQDTDRQGMSRRTLLTGAAAGGVGLAATLVEANPVAAAFSPTGGPSQPGIMANKAPGVGNTFELMVPGFGTFGGFQSVSGLSNEVAVIEFREGSSSGEEVTRLIPGRVAFPSISLSRPIQPGLEMTAWHELVIVGDIAAARKTCSLAVLSYEGKPVARYTLENAWPSKVEIGALNAGGSEVLMETVTIVCEHLERVSA
jgi:phage tail-like protein